MQMVMGRTGQGVVLSVCDHMKQSVCAMHKESQ